MPTYSYTCDACQKSFEKEQRIIEDPIKVCELCGKPKARRQIVSANFILKGSGWYSDGYGSAKSSSASSSSSSSGSAATSTSTGSDTTAKPADSAGKSDGAGKSDSASKSDSGGKPSKAVAAE